MDIRYFNHITVIGSTILSFIVYCLGGYDGLLKTVLALTVIDFITGVLQGIYNKKLNSEYGFKGIIKKVFIYLTIAVAVIIDNWLHNSIPLREIVITFYICNEGISVLENIGKVIVYPKKLQEFFEQLEGGASDGK